MKLSLEEIIQDLRALEARIRAYERKYGVTSQDFYALYQEGLLDDEGFEQSTEFTRWASAYTLKLERTLLGVIRVGGRKDYSGFGQERILPAA